MVHGQQGSRRSAMGVADLRLTLLVGLFWLPGCSSGSSTPSAHPFTVHCILDASGARPGDPDFMPDSMSPGCALLDFDGDGRLDVYVVLGARGPEGSLESDAGTNRLLRQRPDGSFEDATTGSGLGDRGYGMGVAVGDIDQDGDPDVFVTNYGPDRLYRNDGSGTFSDVTEAAGIRGSGWSASAGFFDFDLDGALDLYVTGYLEYDPSVQARDAGGRPEYASPALFPGIPDRLYRNLGDGTFRDVSVESGIASRVGKGLGVVFADLDGDRRADIYVANDGEANFAWIRDDDGLFVDHALTMGLALSGFGQAEAGMGIACGDADGNGRSDLLVTHLVQETHTLYRSIEAGIFEDVTATAGLGAPTVDLTGFGAVLFDLELDGDLDLVTVHGRVLRRGPSPGAEIGPHWRPYAEPDLLFRNDGRGGFTPSPLGNPVEVGRGLAAGDIDGDGDVDLVLANANGTVQLLRNQVTRTGHWLRVRARATPGGADVIGARVRVQAGDGNWWRDITAAGSYLSSQPTVAHFGIGDRHRYDAIVVEWPGGRTERFPGGDVDREVEVVRGQGSARR